MRDCLCQMKSVDSLCEMTPGFPLVSACIHIHVYHRYMNVSTHAHTNTYSKLKYEQYSQQLVAE